MASAFWLHVHLHYHRLSYFSRLKVTDTGIVGYVNRFCCLLIIDIYTGWAKKPDHKVLNSLAYESPFCVIIYTSYKLSKMVRFVMALINLYFRRSIVSPNLCQEYLNMATFRILVLLLIKSSTF